MIRKFLLPFLFLVPFAAFANDFDDFYDATGYYDTFGSSAAPVSLETYGDSPTVYYNTDGSTYYKQTIDGIEWRYTVSDGKVSVGGGDYTTAVPQNTSGTITIPSEIDGCPVVAIRDFAFGQCTNLVEVVIPEGVRSIERRAFMFDSSLTRLVIPASVTSIAMYYTFLDCDRLAEIVVADGNPTFETHDGILFDTILKRLMVCPTGKTGDVIVPSGTESIGDDAFDGCSGLTSIAIPDSVTSFGFSAFAGCSGLTSFLVSDCVTNIGQCAFRDCTGLTSIAIPDSVKHLGSSTFLGCSGLESVFIGNGISSFSWSDSPFEDCPALVEVYFPVRARNWNVDRYLHLPSGCRVFYYRYLSVFSDYGHPQPSGKSRIVGSDAVPVACSVEDFVLGEGDGVRHVCTGWTGTGSVPSTGTGTNAVFDLDADSTLTWNWSSDFRIDCEVGGLADSSVYSDWFREGTIASISFSSSAALGAALMSGDTNGVTLNYSSKCISIPADGPRGLSVRFFETDQEAAVFAEGSERIVPSSSDGDADWFSVGAASASDGLCLRSGAAGSGESSTVETSVSGSGLLSFRWKISGNRGDWLRFFVDGVETNSIDRDKDWADVSLELGNGDHVLRWSWEKSASAAAGENGGFLDDVCWKPYVWLDVQSEFGEAVPVVGSTRLVYGDRVDASVSEPAPSDGTRRVCTGWTAGGSAPASGTGHETSFVIRQNTSLVWNWRTDHWIDVAVTGDGSTAFSPQWVPHGTDATVEIVPVTHLFEITLSGDTDGAVLSGTTLSVPSDGPRSISVSVREVKLSLDVGSVHGEANPAVGNHLLSWGTQISASVAEPAPTNGVRYVCLGWTGTGDVPVSGSGTNVAFTVSGDSSLVWQWQTNVWQSLSVSGPLVASLDGAWFERGTTNLVYYETLAERFSLALSGDTNGVVWDREARTLAVPADDPRVLALDLRVLTLAVALDANGFVWTTAGAAPWIPVEAPDAEDGVFARSGEVWGDGESILSTTVSGPGTLSWTWKLEGDDLAGVDVEVDGRYVLYLSRPCDWTAASIDVSGSDEHIVRFVFWNVRNDTSTPAGRAWIDNVAWTGAAPPGAATKTTEAPVPYAWLAAHAPAILEANGGNFENAANAIAANGRPVWECFVADLDPEDPTSDFRADIVLSNGVPIVAFDPDLGDARIYEIDGKKDLDDVWGPTNDWSRFFRARVSLPEFWSPSGAVDGFPETVTVILDPNGGYVDPAVLVYTSPGLFGDLPIPILGDMPFAGWYSRPEDGVRISSRSCIPWTDATLHARWGVYSIHFEGNGGAGEMEDVVDLFGVDMPLPQNRFVRTGYTFMGWSLRPSGVVVAEDGDVVPDFTSEPASTIVLYARWLPVSYTVRFDANGGDGTMPDQSFVYDSPDTLSSNAFVRTGFSFVGWGTNFAGRVSFADGETVSNLASGSGALATLYAQWLMGTSTVVRSGGLSIRYYDVSSSGYSTWTQSETALTDYFASQTPTIATNTLDWGEGLDAGFSKSTGSDGDNWVSSGMTRPNATCLFHGAYASSSKERFAVLLDGYLSVTASGTYQFAAVADDAVVLYVDGANVLANGQSWGNMATGEIVLAAGFHSISVGFYENTGGQGLSVQWKKPGDSSYTPIPQSVLFSEYTASLDEVRVSFEAVGGEGDAPDDLIANPGETVTLPANPFVRRGYTFSGWAVLPGVEPVFQPGDEVFFDACATLFAAWTPIRYAISFDANGGEGTMELLSLTVSDRLPDNTFTNSGAAFLGWSWTPQSATPRVSDGASVSDLPLENGIQIDLHAVWGKCIRCLPNGGTGVMDDIEVASGDFLPSCPFVREGFTFVGWGTDPDGPARFADESEVQAIPTDSTGFVSLYAMWTSTSLLNALTFGIDETGNAYVSTCRSSAVGVLNVPVSYRGHPVTGVRDHAFQNCSRLTSITIPDGVTSIGCRAFDGCSGLTSITIPDSVTNIADYAFFKCFGLMSIMIPDSVTSIGDGVFMYCSGLTSIMIPDGLTSIGDSTFSDCSGLTSITIPDGVTSIGNYAFRGCSGLTSLTIPDGVASIGDFAWYGCYELTSITIPDSVTNIGIYAFSYCSGVTSVTIPSNVVNVGKGAFGGCQELSSITVLDNPVFDSRGNCNAIIRTADNVLIAGCWKTQIPDGVTSIGGGAFSGCSGLTSIAIPDSVTNIGVSAFASCYGLTSISIPDSVTNIGELAFSGCSGLTSITIPDTVTSIGGSAFARCSGLTLLSLPKRFEGNTSYMGIPSGCTVTFRE